MIFNSCEGTDWLALMKAIVFCRFTDPGSELRMHTNWLANVESRAKSSRKNYYTKRQKRKSDESGEASSERGSGKALTFDAVQAREGDWAEDADVTAAVGELLDENGYFLGDPFFARYLRTLPYETAWRQVWLRHSPMVRPKRALKSCLG